MLKLQAVELSKSYRGRKVVDDVELEIGQGEVVGLLGPNGAGKTTTFYIIVGLARPDSGRVLLNGDEITDLPMYLRARSGISYLPQEPSVFRQLSSEENLLAVLETLPLTRPYGNPRHTPFPAGNAAAWRSPGRSLSSLPLSCWMSLFRVSIR
jgi:lipopolysaccharide export system ATP-binding protein